MEALLESELPVSASSVQGSASRSNDNGSDRDQSGRTKSSKLLSTSEPIATPQVRVALLRQIPLRSLETQGNSHCQDRQGKTYTTINVQSWTGSPLRCRSIAAGAIVVNGLAYQGTIELVRSGDEWLPVNQLDLETYVASVVGAEMPSHWSREALKAQAVAARSYALVHLARPAASSPRRATRWQVYGGETSTAPSTLAAAWQGPGPQFSGWSVESLYAATESIAEAHGHLAPA